MSLTNKYVLYCWALKLEYFTIGYNVLEGLICIAFGYLSSSIALVGFGLDSFIESISACILVWRLKSTIQNNAPEKETELKAVKFVAYSFFILSTYITVEAFRKLYYQEVPDPSLIGIVMTGFSLFIMPFLAHQKYITGRKLNSRALIADSKETIACCFLSATVLIGLLLNYYWELWWADPVASIGIVIFLMKEGVELLKENEITD